MRNILLTLLLLSSQALASVHEINRLDTSKVFLDDFNYTGTPNTSLWTSISGTQNVNGSELEMTGIDVENRLRTANQITSFGAMYVKFQLLTGLSGDTWGGALLGYDGADEYAMVMIRNVATEADTMHRIEIDYNTPSTFVTFRQYQRYTFTPGDTVLAVLLGNRVLVFVNNVLLLNADLPEYPDGKYAGITCWSNNAKFDNVEIGTIAYNDTTFYRDEPLSITQVATDTFSTFDAAKWTTTSGGFAIDQQTAIGTSDVAANIAIRTEAYNSDQYAEARIWKTGAVLVRADADSAYEFGVDNEGTFITDGGIYLAKRNGSTRTILNIEAWSTCSATFHPMPGDTLRLAAIGSTLIATINGRLVFAVDDTTITTGSPGIAFQAAADSGRIDDFSAGNVNGLAAVPTTMTEGKFYQLWFLASTLNTNPYQADSIDATFTGTAGEAATNNDTVKTFGFWLGGKLWSVRFSPNYSGSYSYSTSGSDANFTSSGTITVNDDPAYIGRLQPSGVFFKYDRGGFIGWWGDTQWNLTSDDPSRGSKTWHSLREIAADRIDKSFNVMQILLHEDPNLTWFSNLYEHTGLQAENSEYNYDPIYWNFVDWRMKYLWSHGMTTALVMAWANYWWQFFDHTEGERYAKTAIARYSAGKTTWLGIAEYEWLQSDSTEWNWIADFIRNNEPYHNLVTLHTYNRDDGGTAGIIEHLHLDYFSDQISRSEDAQYDSASTLRSQENIPYINAEFGYEVMPGEINGWVGTYQDSTGVLEDAWALMFAGSAGITYGHQDLWKADTLNKLSARGSFYVKYMKKFFESDSVRFFEMDEWNKITAGHYWARDTNGNKQIMVWSKDGTSLTVDASLLTQAHVVWFNSINGSWSDGGDVTPSSSLTLTPPGAHYAGVVFNPQTFSSVSQFIFINEDNN
ncbi:DUF4038 domain-containing protein [Candidatus Parcubacteria bacterium]|nr:MAG: DUF4038 domain-containing protein [Candidatus Parcubacteria bacterium]